MSRPQDKRLPYMPGIDALRAIAVLAVFFYHVNTGGWMPGGFLGVDVFFVISGYLITALLLSEYRRTGHLNVLRFWMRRARRLLPAVAVMIAITFVIAAIVAPDEVPSLRGDALASLFYVNNWHLLLSDQSYFQQFARPSLFLHLWSLSVEEQFYLLWPLVFAAGMKLFGSRRLLLGVLAGAAATTLLMIILFDPGSPDRDFYGTDTRAVGLLLGVALAMVWHPSRLRPVTGRGARWILDGVGVFALVMVIRSFLDVHDFDPGLYHGGFLLLAFWTTLLVGVLAHPAARLGRVLGNPALVWLGLRSYSFYLWHWPVLMLTRPGVDVPMHGPLLVALQLAATIALADLSYRYVEQPFRQRRGSRTAPAWLGLGRPALAAGVAATVLIVGWSGIVSEGRTTGLRPELASAQTGRPGSAGSTEAGGPAAAVGLPSLRDPPQVLALGDSVMAGAADALRREFGGDAVVDAQEGRQPTDYPEVVRYYRAAVGLPNDVIVQIGNNGPVWYDDLVALRDALSGVDHVYLVNVEVPRSWEGEVNSELSRFVPAEWPQATVIDWHAAAAGSDDLTYDQVHLTPQGQRLYVSVIAQAFK
jgi:peptidoglycan/LPS O-acetylase OafA/YrhL